MGTPCTSQTRFTATGGVRTCVELSGPPRGTIRAIKIKQLDGTAVDATAALYSIFEACESDGSASSSASCPECVGGPAYLGDPDLYRITPDLAVVAGSYLEFQLGYLYCNRDRYAPNLQRRIYLEFAPDGAGAQEWGIALEIEAAELNS